LLGRASMATRAPRLTINLSISNFRRTPSALGAALTLLAALGTASAKTKTSTTLPPTSYSAPTAACIQQATKTLKQCKQTSPDATCRAAFDLAFPTCFAPGKGVTCAAGCVGKNATCLSKVVLDPTCPGTCTKQRVAAGSQCGSDPTCVAAVNAQYLACKDACKNPPAAVKCTTGFDSCLAKCPNLFDPNAPTTTTLAPPTTSTTTTLVHPTTTTTTKPRTTTTTTTTTTTVKRSTTTSTLKATTTSTTSTTKPPKPTTTTTLKAPKPTTTTTTLPPLPPFSDATKACIERIGLAQVKCTLSPAACQEIYYTSFPECFAAGAGVACAATCENVDIACETAKVGGCGACQNGWVSAGRHCRSDATCLSATANAFNACHTACKNPRTVGQCRADFATCLGACTNLPRFVDAGDGTIADNVTGLQWEKKIAGAGCPHCVMDTGTWSTTGANADGTIFTTFLVALNDGPAGTANCVRADNSVASGFAGHCDWRVPTLAELQTLIAANAPGCGSGGACIDPTFAPTAPAAYWSSTTNVSDPLSAWGVDFGDGSVDFGAKSLSLSVRAVRGGS